MAVSVTILVLVIALHLIAFVFAIGAERRRSEVPLPFSLLSLCFFFFSIQLSNLIHFPFSGEGAPRPVRRQNLLLLHHRRLHRLWPRCRRSPASQPGRSHRRHSMPMLRQRACFRLLGHLRRRLLHPLLVTLN